jgi:hypothetical protein
MQKEEKMEFREVSQRVKRKSKGSKTKLIKNRKIPKQTKKKTLNLL